MIEGMTTSRTEKERDFTSALAIVEQRTPRGLILKIDGENEAREKEYTCNQAYMFCEGDRVKVSKISGTYIVEYPVGAPSLYRTVVYEYAKQENGRCTWEFDKIKVSFEQVSYSGVDVRTAKAIDLSDVGMIKFKIWFHTFSDPNGLYLGAVKEKLTAEALSPWDSSFAALKKLGTNDLGRRIHTVDVSKLKGEYFICCHSFSQTYDVEGIYLA